MGQYIYTILPDTDTIYNLERNNGLAVCSIMSATAKIAIGDEIFIYLGDNTNYRKNLSVVMSMCNRIAYRATVVEIFGENQNLSGTYQNIEMYVSRLSEYAADNLTLGKLIKFNQSFQPQQNDILDLAELQYNEILSYIKSILVSKKIVSSVPQSYEEKILNDQERIIKLNSPNTGQKSAKANGNIASSIFKKYIEIVFKNERMPFKVSQINAYIFGCATEWDALILKADARDVFGCGIYDVHDVLAVLEFKRSGIFFNSNKGGNAGTALKNFFASYEDLKKENKDLNAGYITMTDHNSKSKNSVKYIDNTIDAFESHGCINSVFCIEETSHGGIMYDNHTIGSATKMNWTEFIKGLVN